jgi:formamidopyrimidine-DNA glycosylase
MPELPEVETVRRGLIPVMEGEIIKTMQVRREGLRWPFPERMGERLTGAKVLRIGRRSKYVLLGLDTDETLIIHLGMSGRMLISGHQMGKFHHDHPAPEKHDHVVFDMGNGARITFNDPRRFGAMDLCKTLDLEDHKLIAVLGPEPLGNSFDENYLVTALSKKNTPIKTALLDQRIIAGLGNIYVCEVLFRAGLHPARKVAKISGARISALVPIIREVLSEAIQSGGSSLRDYRQADGDLGYFQHSFRVYGRENQPCVTSGCTGSINRITQSGRSSFYCAQCQR